MSESNNCKVKVFISYSPEDENLRTELEKHLKVLEKNNIITIWHHNKIMPGSESEIDINKNLRSSQIILLLISSDFVSSDHYENEVSIAMELHYKNKAIVIPIMIRPIDDWESSYFGKLEVLPQNKLPVALWKNSDEAFSIIVKGIRERIEIFINENNNSYEKNILSNISNKYNRNINFRGREDNLDKIKEYLHYDESKILIQSLIGMGGIGKTQLAIEYAYKFKEFYKIVWWISSESKILLENDYLDLGKKLGYKEEYLDRNSIIKETKRYLENNENWLLIFDNAIDVDSLIKYIPQMGKGHIIITSRNRNWSEIGEDITIDVFEKEEAIEFLLKRSRLEDKYGAEELAYELGYLPLALEQAASYIINKGKTISSYLELLKRYQIKLFEKSSKLLSYEQNVATTWNISFENIRDKMPEAQSLLNILAFLYPSDIPVDLFIKNIKIIPQVLKDELMFDNIIEEFLKYSLISINNNNISIHRLVQSVIRSQLDEEEQKRWINLAFNILDKELIFDIEDKIQRSRVSKIISHVQEVLKYLYHYKIISNDTIKFVRRLNIYFYECGMHNDSLKCLEEMLDKSENLYGIYEENIIMLKKDISETYIILSKCDISIKYLKEALIIEKNRNDNRGSNIEIALLAGLAKAYEGLDEIKSSLDYINKAYELSKIQIYKDDEQILKIKFSLAQILYRHGEIMKSFNIFEDILSTKCIERLLPKQQFSYILADYAFVLGDNTENDKEKKKSINLIEKALKIDKEIYEKNHPKVIRDLNNYGYLLDKFGKFEEAEIKFKEAISIKQNISEYNYSETGILLSNYGMNLFNLGKYEESEQLLKKAIEINTSLKAYSQLAIDYTKIGRLYFSIGKNNKGLEYLKEALEIDKRIYGDYHKEVLTDLLIIIKYCEDLGIKKDLELYRKEVISLLENNKDLTKMILNFRIR